MHNTFAVFGSIVKVDPESVDIKNALNQVIRVHFDEKIKASVSDVLKADMRIALRGHLTIVNDELRLVAEKIASWGR